MDAITLEAIAEHLPEAREGRRAERLDAFVAVTDIYLWKLLRRDLRRSQAAARRVVPDLIDGLIATATARPRK